MCNVWRSDPFIWLRLPFFYLSLAIRCRNTIYNGFFKIRSVLANFFFYSLPKTLVVHTSFGFATILHLTRLFAFNFSFYQLIFYCFYCLSISHNEIFNTSKLIVTYYAKYDVLRTFHVCYIVTLQ